LRAPSSGWWASGPGDAGRRSGRLREEESQDLQRDLEAVDAYADLGDRDAVIGVLAFVPPGAEADDEPPAGHAIEDGSVLGQDRGTPVRVRQDGVADPLAGHPVSQRRGERDGIPCMR
jgi:hypothetical protein